MRSAELRVGRRHPPLARPLHPPSSRSSPEPTALLLLSLLRVPAAPFLQRARAGGSIVLLVGNLAGPSSAPAFYPKGDVPTRRGVLRFLPAAPSPTGEKEVPAASRCVHWSTQTQVRGFVQIVYYIDFVSPSAYVKLWAVTKYRVDDTRGGGVIPFTSAAQLVEYAVRVPHLEGKLDVYMHGRRVSFCVSLRCTTTAVRRRPRST